MPSIADMEISRAAQHLRAGGLVAFPTETVYGLGADALSPAAVSRVFALKGRPSANPLIVHVADEAMARRVASVWPSAASRIAKAFWPGPITLVLPKAEVVPAIVTGGSPNVGIRIPDHPVAMRLLKAFDGPLVGPSANPSGGISPTTARHVRESFASSDEPIILDGGPCRVGIESTVVSLVNPEHPVILRPGAIGLGDLERVLGARIRTNEAPYLPASGPVDSPGLLGRHYAPRTPARLGPPALWPSILATLPAGVRAVAIAWSSSTDALSHTSIRMPSDLRQYAAQLYAALRRADAMHAAILLIEPPPAGNTGDEGLAAAVADRLRRATSDEPV